MTDEHPAPTTRERSPAGLRQLIVFLVLALIGLAVGMFTPLRDILTLDNVRMFSERLGWWGPLVLIALGAVLPLLFLPRWPICFAAGLLYGLVWGTLVASVASLAGAWLHYVTARHLVSPSSLGLLRRLRVDPEQLTPTRGFWLIFLLRAFPLSNSAATNLLAGALHLGHGPYLAASFLGMIPSTLMYASWGKLMKQPDPYFYAVAVGLLLVMMLGTVLLHRRFFAEGTADAVGE